MVPVLLLFGNVAQERFGMGVTLRELVDLNVRKKSV
jgi:hypothetical protein